MKCFLKGDAKLSLVDIIQGPFVQYMEKQYIMFLTCDIEYVQENIQKSNMRNYPNAATLKIDVLCLKTEMKKL